MRLLDLLERAASGRGVVRFLPDDGGPLSFAELWQDSERAARVLSARIPEGGTVAAVLTSSPRCLAVLIGAWRAGLLVASLPTPARAMSAAEYQAQIEAMCAGLGADLLLVDDAYLPLVPPLSVAIEPFSAALRAARGGRVDSAGSFVQFSSGSTAAPKGILLGLEAIAANVTSILAVLEPRPGDVACSWLPLSHDMGLVGLCLTPWVAAGPDYVGEGTLCLIRTEAFLQRPSLWLEACSELRASFTGAPNFAFDLARRTVTTIPSLDLRPLRACITGGELVRAETLRAFAEATAPAGFRSETFCPAYGLAEATLAVTMIPPSTPWMTRTIDAAALAEGRWEEKAEGRELVSAGPPIPGMKLRVAARDGGVGPIEVGGPSLLTAYVGADRPVARGGWLPTADLGCVIDGELFPVSRSDDVLVLAGRKLHSQDVEDVAGRQEGVWPGRAVALVDGRGRYLVVAEPSDSGDLDVVGGRVHSALVEQLALGPSAVLFVRPGALPKTPSGKIQRHRVRALLDGGRLPTQAEVAFLPAGR